MTLKHPNRTALYIAATYVVVAGVWILLSDQLVMAFWKDRAGITLVQTCKGWFFVAVTGGVLYWWIRGAIGGGVLAGKKSAGAEMETRRLEMMLEGGSEAFFSFDHEWRYTHMNRQGEAMAGRPAADLLGRVIWEAVPDTVGTDYQQACFKVAKTRKAEVFDAYFPPWGKWFEGRIYPLAEGVVVFARDVTERHGTEERLHEATQRLKRSELRLKAAQARAKMGSWEADMTTKENWWSEELCRMFNRDPSLGPPPLPEFLELLHPEDRPMILNTAAEMPALRSVKTEKFRSNPAHGPVRYFDAIVEAIYDEQGNRVKAGGTIMDVTEQRLAEQALSESELKYRRIVETAEEGIWMFDTENRTRFANGKLASMLGTTVERMTGRPIAEFMDTEWREEAAKSHERCRKGERTTQDFKFIREDGTEIWTSISTAPIFDVNGDYDGALAMVTDVTERKRLEEQLRQAQKMEAIGQLSGGVAHDFNNLLTVIKGQLSLLQCSGPRDEETEQALDDIEAAADRAANLTRQLLAFSRRQVLQLRDLNLNDVVEGMASMMRRIVGEDVEVKLACAATPMPVRADTGMMEQVLLNLVVNARDAMPGGGWLRIETAQVEIDGETARKQPEARAGKFVRLTVVDTGTGIAAETLPKIFEPFFTTKEFGKGTGLGLATVYGIVQQHHGWIAVESGIGLGTRFHVYLPGHEEVAASHEPEAVETVTKPGGGETILLVEDEAEVRAVARFALVRQGYRVIEAAQGVLALAAWAEHRDEIDLLLTDVVMPGGISGVELALKLRAEKRSLRVVCMSGYSPEMAGKNFALREGVNFLPKPFEMATLTRVVRACLDGKDSAAPF